MSQYDGFAEDFARTRRHPWSFLSDFIRTSLSNENDTERELGIDLGCGAGQYFPVLIPFVRIIVGADLSFNLLRIAKKMISNVVQCEAGCLPFRNNVFDCCLCAALLHHFLGREHRVQVMHELKAILKPNGQLVLTVWKRWQEKFQRQFLTEGLRNAHIYLPAGNKEFGDIDIGWTDSRTGIRYARTYHLFTEAELRDLLQEFTIMSFKHLGHMGKRDNYAVFVQKSPILSSSGTGSI